MADKPVEAWAGLYLIDEPAPTKYEVMKALEGAQPVRAVHMSKKLWKIHFVNRPPDEEVLSSLLAPRTVKAAYVWDAKLVTMASEEIIEKYNLKVIQQKRRSIPHE